ncbi:MAG: hypothetical protein SGILL_003789, partial [Bacillariaceae sp.]
LRICLYWIHVLSEDIETQKKGFVWILTPSRKSVDKYKQLLGTDLQVFQDCKDLFDNKPVRVSAMHFVHPPGALLQLLKAFFMLRLSSQEERSKTKFHSGSSLETQYDLHSYGIPVQELPITATGTIKTKNHLLWIKGRKLIDKVNEHGAMSQQRFGVFHPGLSDVLFSRGGNATHFGNMELRQMMMSRMDHYNNGGRKERLEDRKEIVDLVHKNGGRFLNLGKDGLWEEIEDEKLLMEKLTNAFYDINRKSIAKSRQRVYQSDTSNFLNPSKRQRTGPLGIDKGQGCV